MTPTQKLARHFIQTAADDLGIDLRDYSGRGMYGGQCVATSQVDRDEFMFKLGCVATKHSHANGEDSEVDLFDVTVLLLSVREDSLGMGRIVYWPRIPFKEE